MTFRLSCVVLFLLLFAHLVPAQSLKDILKSYEQGYASYQQGEYYEALASYERSLKFARQAKFPQNIAANLTSMGFIYGLLGHYDKALVHLQEGLKIVRQLNHAHDIAATLHSLGAVYFFSSQYDKALAHFEEALKIPQGFTNPREVAAGLNSLGVVYGSLGEYDKALGYFAEVLEIGQQLNSAEDIATTLNNMATVYVFQQRYQDAERTSLEADKIQQQTRLPWRAKAVLVEVYLATHQYDKALALLQDIVPVLQDSDHYRFDFYTQQGLALQGRWQLAEAASSLAKAVSLAEEMRQRVADRLTFFGVSAQGGRIRAYRALVATLAERALHGERVDPAFAAYGQSMAAYALYFAEATKARVLLETMATAARQTAKVALPPALRAEEENLHAQLAALQEQWPEASKRGEAAVNALLERKQRLTQDLHALIARLRQEYPRYAALHYPQPMPPEALPLKDQEVLLEYALGEEATYLFRVRKGSVDRVWRLPVGRAELERQVRTFLLPLQQSGGSGMAAFSPRQGHSLYSLLLAEALQGITPGTPIIIVPDGILGLLPFETLVITPGRDVKDTRFVGDMWQLSYAQSATVLAFLRTLAPSAAPQTFFGLGNPIYDSQDPRYTAYKQGLPLPVLPAQALSAYGYRGRAIQRGGGNTTRGDDSEATLSYPPLPETESEVKAIAQFFGTSLGPPNILLNVVANETQLRQAPLTRYRYLHFATHADLPGRLQGINEPFLILGQVENTEEDDGLLALSEVLDLRLDAEMVVLSACVTGRGEATEGEGVVNFARAFHQAGARSVVVSLWEVASEAAEDFMRRFYGHLNAGKPKAEALSLARKEIKALYPNPFFWAAFILHGEG
jgi:tetratricopeptide (TPR) repeat protein